MLSIAILPLKLSVLVAIQNRAIIAKRGIGGGPKVAEWKTLSPNVGNNGLR